MMATDECFISIYGTLRRHSWLSAEAENENGHSLFDAFGTAIGWGGSGNTPADDGALWHLFDAGWNWSDDVTHLPDHLLWIHTGLTGQAKRTGLPIFQLGECATKVLQRVGSFNLMAVQMLLPIGSATLRQPASFIHILNTSRANNLARFRLEIDGGDDPTFVDSVDRIVTGFNAACSWQGLQFNSYEVLSDNSRILLEPAEMMREGWLGSSAGRIVVNVTAPEFSMDLISYTFQQLAWHSQRSGVQKSVILTAFKQ